MTEIIKLDGSPGGGKTTALADYLRDEKRDGLGPEGFWWLNFTNSGRKDVTPTLVDIYPDSDDVTDRAKTVHGLALSLCLREGVIDGENLNDVIIQQGNFDDEPGPYAEFCEARGLPYDPDAANPRKLLSGEKQSAQTGNKLFAVNDYLQQTCKLSAVIDDAEYQKVRSTPVNIRTPPKTVMRLLREWREYKQQAFDLPLYEHGDYVKEAIEQDLTPAVDVLLIDEFQDLAPLEYKLFKQWRDSGTINRIYISGDPNQSIYSFRGGTPYYFENTDVDTTVTLKQSYRCPKRIARVGRTILDSHPATDARGFDGQQSGGLVDWSDIHDKHDLRDAILPKAESYDADPSVMLLTRTNRQRKRLMNALQSVGIPFETLGKTWNLWDGDMAQYLSFLTNWQNDAQAFAKPNVRNLLKALPDGETRRKKLGDGIGQIIERDTALPVVEGLTPLEAVDRLEVKSYEREALRNALEAPTAMQPDDVRVGTVHTSKGLEAPVVYLFTTSSNTTVQQYRRDDSHAAEEHRTYYVGATRASEELHLVESFFSGPTAPPIRKLKTHSEAIA